MSDWWNKMSKTARAEYIKKHPNSVHAGGAAKKGAKPGRPLPKLNATMRAAMEKRLASYEKGLAVADKNNYGPAWKKDAKRKIDSLKKRLGK